MRYYAQDTAGNQATETRQVIVQYTSPSVSCDTVDITVGAHTLMACNLGASMAGTTTDSYGNHYQRGNNYGFPSDSDIVISGTNRIDASSYGPITPYYSDMFIKNTIWESSNNSNLRGGAGDTTSTNGTGTLTDRQGPCPDGYHIPSTLEWDEVIEEGTSAGYTLTELSEKLLLPFA